MKIGEGEYKLILERIMRPEAEWKKEMLGEWTEEVPPPKLVYILASNYQIAKNIYRRLYPEGRNIDLRYVRGAEVIMGTRNIDVLVSDERYPDQRFYDLLSILRHHEQLGRIKLVYERELNGKLQKEETQQEDTTNP